MLVVIIWFLIVGIFGPLFGKLTSVQENNNSSFLPKGAEATQASEVIQTFSGKDSFNLPALVHEIGPKIWWPSKLQNE